MSAIALEGGAAGILPPSWLLVAIVVVLAGLAWLERRWR